MNHDKARTKEKFSFIISLLAVSLVATMITIGLEYMIDQSEGMQVFNTLNVPTIVGLFIIATTMYLDVLNTKR